MSRQFQRETEAYSGKNNSYKNTVHRFIQLFLRILCRIEQTRAHILCRTELIRAHTDQNGKSKGPEENYEELLEYNVHAQSS